MSAAAFTVANSNDDFDAAIVYVQIHGDERLAYDADSLLRPFALSDEELECLPGFSQFEIIYDDGQIVTAFFRDFAPRPLASQTHFNFDALPDVGTLRFKVPQPLDVLIRKLFDPKP